MFSQCSEDSATVDRFVFSNNRVVQGSLSHYNKKRQIKVLCRKNVLKHKRTVSVFMLMTASDWMKSPDEPIRHFFFLEDQILP